MAIDPKAIEDVYEFGSMQLGMLFHALESGDSGLYVVQLSYQIDGTLDTDVFEEAWHRVVAHHPVLRAAFAWERVAQPRQVVLRDVQVPFERLDWSDRSEEAQRAAHLDLLREDRSRGFDLSQAPLQRMWLLRISETSHVFVWSFHHLLLDGWSINLVLRQVLTTYEALRAGREPQLQPGTPYGNYVRWVARQDHAGAEAFWREDLAGLTGPTAVPPEPHALLHEDDGTGNGHLEVELPPEEARELERFSASQRITLGTLVHAAWGLLLGRWSGTDEVIFGTVAWARPRALPGADAIVGPCMNTLPLRVPLDPTAPVGEWLAALQLRMARVREHEYVPLPSVRSWSEVPPDLPLFNSLLAFQSFGGGAGPSQQVAGLEITEYHASEFVNYPLALEASPRRGLALRFLYARDHYNEATIARLAEDLRRLLNGLAADGDRPLGSVPMLGAQDRRRVVETFNDTATTWSSDLPVHRRVAEQARRRPDAVAVVDPDGAHTYADLDRRANRLANALRDAGVGAEDPVALVLPRSADLVCGMLAALKAGAAYLPLDPDSPVGRIDALLADACASVVVTRGDTADRLDRDGRTVFRLDAAAALDGFADVDPDVRVDPDNLAYMVFTSGSTGRPKCAGNPHRGFANTVEWTAELLELSGDDRASVACNPAFDGSTWELWPALTRGASLRIPDDDTRALPERLRDWLVEQRVTVGMLPTPMAEHALALEWPDDTALRLLLTGGGALRRWPGSRFPARLVNNYGVAEASVVSTSVALHPKDEGGQPPPIGGPIPNTTAYVVDSGFQPVPVGVAGEVYVGGEGVGRGYVNRPGLTAQRFVPDPFGPPGSRLYRTGDVARWLPDGTLEFVGRADDQIELRGLRIEPGEVEAALLSHPDVAQAAVAARQTGGGSGRALVAYVVGANGPADAAGLREFAAERLPAYMVPQSYVDLDTLPLSANGKVDRARLPDPSPGEAESLGFVEPRTELETTLAKVWCAVLGAEKVGVHDNFFELGGDSITSIQVVAKAAQEGVALSPALLFQEQTVAELAEAMGGGPQDGPVADGESGTPARKRRSPLVPIAAEGARPPLFFVHPINGLVASYYALGERLGTDRPLYGLQALDEQGTDTETVETTAARYVEAIREVRPEGPYLLGGWSYGGIVAYEMARQLRAAGSEVGLLALLDTPGPQVFRLLPDVDPKRMAAMLRREVGRRYGRRAKRLVRKSGEDWVRSVEASYRRRLEAAAAYKPPSTFDGRITLFRASKRPDGARSMADELLARIDDPTFGWLDHATEGVETQTLPGKHDDFFDEPALSVLAERLGELMDQIDEEAGDVNRGRQQPGSDDESRRQRRGAVLHLAGGPRDPGGLAGSGPAGDRGGVRGLHRGALDGHASGESQAPHGRRGRGWRPMTDVAVLDHVSKRYGEKEALRDISLKIGAGESVALLGPNGAGKTTTISLLVGLREATSGRVEVFGQDPRKRAVRSLRGVMLQDSKVPDNLRVRELIDLFRSYYPDPLPTGEVLELADLVEQAKVFAGALSGGQRQRLFYALAVCGNPPVLFLDEPSVGMDVASRRSFLEGLRRFKDSGATLILTTHYLEEADALAERVLVVDDGRVVEDAPPSVIKARIPSKRVEFTWEGSRDALEDPALPVGSVRIEGNRAVMLSHEPEQLLARLFNSGVTVRELQVTGADLEEAFLALTDKEAVR
jgi:amino acid adenylation domain-containing protein